MAGAELDHPHRRSQHPLRWLAAGALVLALGMGGSAPWWPTWRLGLASDEQLLDRAIARPADAGAQWALAERLRQRGEDAAALIALEHVVTLRPGNLAARRDLAASLLERGRVTDALLHLREIARRDPNDPFAQEHLGEWYLDRGAVSWAADAFEQVVAARPRNARAWAHLGECDLALHQAAPAVRAFQRASDLEPNRPQYLVGLGRAHLEAGRPDRAEAALRRALSGPEAANAAYWLGVLCLTPAPGQRTRGEEAVHWLEEACRLDPNAADPLLALGNVWLRRHRPERAVPLLERAAALAPDQPEPLYRLGRAYLASVQTERANAVLRRFAARAEAERQRQHLELRLTQSPGDPALRLRLAQWYARYGDKVGAVTERRGVGGAGKEEDGPHRP